MCKKIFFIFIFVFVFLSFSFTTILYAENLSAKSIVLLEADSGEVVFEKNARISAPMASTTKIMTAIVVLENCELDKKFVIPKEATNIEGSSVYLHEGETLTVRELLYALLLESANDSAVALAYATSGDVDEFVSLMNEKATSLGLTSTHFDNPHGLDSKSHYTSAYELAKISAYAMKNPQFKEIVSTYKKIIPLNDGEGKRVLINHNKLLRLYDGANGIKTGFTKKSGRCFVSSAERDGVRLICASLNAPDDWNDHMKLFDYGFEKYESLKFASPLDYLIELNIEGGNVSSFYASNLEELKITLPRKKRDISTKIVYNDISLPIKEGDIVGKIIFYNYDKEIASLNLYSINKVSKKTKKSIFERIFKNGKNQTSKIFHRHGDNVAQS